MYEDSTNCTLLSLHATLHTYLKAIDTKIGYSILLISYPTPTFQAAIQIILQFDPLMIDNWSFSMAFMNVYTPWLGGTAFMTRAHRLNSRLSFLTASPHQIHWKLCSFVSMKVCFFKFKLRIHFNKRLNVWSLVMTEHTLATRHSYIPNRYRIPILHFQRIESLWLCKFVQELSMHVIHLPSSFCTKQTLLLQKKLGSDASIAWILRVILSISNVRYYFIVHVGQNG